MKMYLDEPRLRMNAVSRSLVRWTSSLFYATLAALTAALLITDIPSLRWSGVLLTLFLGDRLLYAGRAAQSFKHLTPEETNINIASFFSPRTLAVLERASDRATFLGGDFSLHLAKLLLENRLVREGLSRLDVSAKDFERKVDEALDKANAALQDAETLSAARVTIAEQAFFSARRSGESALGPHNLFAGLALVENASLTRLMNLFAITPGDLEDALLLARLRAEAIGFGRRLARLFARHHAAAPRRIMNRAWTARPTPTLDLFSEDITESARSGAGELLVGHEKEYEDLVRALSRPVKPNALLVGDPGSGKETILRHLTFMIAVDRVPTALFDKRVTSLRLGSVTSGAPAEEVARRMNALANEIIAAGNIVLYIPDIHHLVKTSGPGTLSAADILLPIILNDAFPVVGATYPKEFKEFVESQTDFAAAFEVIRVREMSETDAVRLLTYHSVPWEDEYRTMITFDAVKAAVAVAHKYLHHKLLPGSAKELLKEALADATQRGDRVLEPEDVVAIAERKTNIPIHRPGKEEAEKLLRLEEIIHARLIDQDEAVRSVSQALREYRSGLSRAGGPIAAFLFVGPTGVGKTELAKTLAEVQFGSETMMLRFDMSEYQDKQSFFRFIGSPDGKIAGMLTEAVIQKPYSLILLDEFEKAHPDILHLFLQVFDDGRLTDNLGRTVSFTNTIIIATSNAHSDFIKEQIEAYQPIEAIAEELTKKLTGVFRPELLNRFSRVIVFRTLTPEHTIAIARIQLMALARSLAEAQGITLSFDEAAIRKVAGLGYDPVFGARPLRGMISEKLRGPLAEKILRGSLLRGDAVRVILSGDQFQLLTTTEQSSS